MMKKTCVAAGLLWFIALSCALGEPDKSITIHQEIDLTAMPQKVYEALLDSKQFTDFSGREGKIDREIGGASSLFKGHIVARNLELVPNQRIVQGWRVLTWPEGAWFIARVRIATSRPGNTYCVRSHRFSRRFARSLGPGLGGKLLVAAQEISPMIRGACL